jgi:AraC-like DNA-binding protein
MTQKRLNFACERLLASEDVLSSALESGFADLSHFYRVFHHHRGMTPLAFLRQNFDLPIDNRLSTTDGAGG